MSDFQAYRARLAALPERDQQILKLAHAAVNAMGFACQGAAQGNDNMEERYSRKAGEHMAELERLLLGEASK